MPADGNRLSGLGERESERVEHADGNRPATSEVNNKLRLLMLCSSKPISTSLLSIQRSLSTRMGGPGGDAGELPAEATVAAEPLLCHVLGAVVHGWGVLGSRSLRIRFAMYAVRTCKCKFFCCGANRH